MGVAPRIKESNLSLEVVILLIFGVFMLLFGLLLLAIHTGNLPYNQNSKDFTYGLFLVLVSFQVITMGKTPFGDLRRSWALIIMGICTATLGMAACFLPGYLTEYVRVLVGILLFAGGISLLIQLSVSKKKARMWLKIGGIFQQLTIACGLVYALAVVSGLITLFPGFTTVPQIAILLIIFGTSFFYLSWCLWKIAKSYPPENPNDMTLSIQNSDKADSIRRFRFFRDASLPHSQAILILLGILLAFLGLLLFPVNLGVLPFFPDGQFGLLLTIMAIQMMALGETPLGQYKRSGLMIIIGIIFAALGAVSCIVPGLLTGIIQILLGFLNIMSGAALLIKRFLPRGPEIRTPPETPAIVPPIVKKLAVIQTVLAIVSLAFGISMLVPGFVSGLLIAGILVINGLLLFILVSLLQKVTRMQLSREPS